MLEQFKKHISEKKLFTSDERILLAVSGGIDSVVMCELFHLVKSKFAIAHCNFQLRGKDSEKDERFVKNLAIKYKVKFFCKKFKTAEQASNKGISVQMAARELRYEWFEKIRKQNSFDFIAIATQKDDEIETVLLNLTRGTGISGLHGIFPKRDKIIRPLLFATRREILEFAAERNLKWREDKSNVSDDYVRNKIRHKVIPVLREINPNIEQTFSQNIVKIREAEIIFHQHIEEKRKEIMKSSKMPVFISIDELLRVSPLKTYLFEFLKPYNFNETVVEEIISSLLKQSGKKFFSPTHYIVKDRNFLLLQTNPEMVLNPLEVITAQTKIIKNPLPLKFRIAGKTKFRIVKDEKTAQLDFEKLKFPLIIRPWKAGDSFVPLGMKGRKKVSDFLIDKKIPATEKQKIFVLVSFGEIVWIAGHRISERFKADDSTKYIFLVKML